MREPRSKLRVMSACGRSFSHRIKGKSGSVLQRPAMKWFLKVRMARSAALRRWMWGGASWKSMSWLSMNCMSAVDASLSSRWRLGLSPRVVKRVRARL